MTFRFPKSALPPEPSDYERQRRSSMAREEYARLKNLYRRHINAERDAERRTLEARNAQAQAERRQIEAAAAADEEKKQTAPVILYMQ